jgi:hypothetical protein
MADGFIVMPVDHIDRFSVSVKYLFLNENTNQLEKNMSLTSKTQMGTTSFQNLDAFSALTEISDGAAATYNGGQITLYDGIQTQVLGTFNFGGKQTLISNDQISSINIDDNSQWRLFSDANYQGYGQTFGKGKTTLPPALNNKVSSFVRVA